MFRRLRVIAPSGSDTGEIRRQLVAGISDHVVREGGERPDASWDQKMARLVDVDATTGLASEQVLALLDATPEYTAVAILSAAEYTSPDTPSPFAPGETRIMGQDEMWARRLHALATAAADVAERRELFVVLDTGREPPSGEWAQLLQSVPGCSLLGLWRQSAEHQVQERLPEWRRMMEEGGLGAVLRELGDMPGLDEYGRATIRIQLLAAAGQPDQAMAEISALDPNVSPPADLAAKLALIAARAGGSDTAGRMLRDSRDDILGREDVQNALQAGRARGGRGAGRRLRRAARGAAPHVRPACEAALQGGAAPVRSRGGSAGAGGRARARRPCRHPPDAGEGVRRPRGPRLRGRDRAGRCPRQRPSGPN